MDKEHISKLSEDEAKKLLKEIILKLEDFFGTEGWRHYLGIED